jgi:antitoxin CcdA
MDLGTYLRQNKLTLQAFGARVGVAHSTVLRWADGTSRPRDERHLRAIAEATGGAVTAADFAPAPKAPGMAEAQAPFVQEARALGLDAEAIAAAALKQAIGDEKARRWAEENREAIAAWNRHFEENDTPLAEFRAF